MNEHEADVCKLHEFEDMYFYVIDENGDAQVSVTDANFDDDVEISVM